ncbi:MAG: hypothetical protein RIR97_1375 [Pseudomonadota bacterium]
MSATERAIFLSPKAEHDLEDIWLYTYKNWSIEQADTYIDLILKHISDAGKGIGLARAAPELGKSIKRCNSGSHVVYFRETETRIVVLRILHGRMDPARHV